MDLLPVEIPPGVVTTPTALANSSNWKSSNLMRWDGGVMEPIGGWESVGYTAPSSNVRKIHSWTDNTARKWVAYLCEGHVYVEYDGDLVDISPTPALEAPSSDYSAGGYGDLDYGDDDYGDARAGRPDRKSIGPSFKLDNWGENLIIMSSADGRLLEWVPPVSGSPSPCLEVMNNPISDSGSKTDASAVISSLSDTSDMAVGMYVRGNGVPEGSKILTVDSGTQITLDTNLTETESSAISVFTVTRGRTFVVTPERHIVVFDYNGIVGGFAWCDQEDNTDWDYASLTSKAGNHTVEPAAPIVAAEYVGVGTLFFTTKKPYLSGYVGLPYIYTNGVEQGSCGIPISPQSLARTSDGAAWVSEDGFWQFNGVSISPMSCDIWSWIIENIDWDLARQTAFVVNMVDQSELWFFFPEEGGSTNTLAAVHNYRDGWWAQHVITRSAAFAASFIGNPFMADGTTVYKHNSGNRYPGAGLPWIESFEVNIKNGGQLSTLQFIRPEIEGDYENLRFRTAFHTRRTPKNESYSGQRSVQASGDVWFDVTCMGFRVRVDYTESLVMPFKLGAMAVAIKNRGKRV